MESLSALKKGVGIYISPLPRYIKREIINLFEDDVIGTLIVTTSFTEGVNTSASNLIFTSLINGPTTNRLSDIDVLNVSGRAGRFARNSIGKVYFVWNELNNGSSNRSPSSGNSGCGCSTAFILLLVVGVAVIAGKLFGI